MDKEFADKIREVQNTLKATKDLTNKFGGYSYRSNESILEALKKPLYSNGLFIIQQDEIVQIGDRFYLKATSIVSDGEKELSASAFAREPLSKKGMDESQITGAASSYARKYSLNGLFAIDDNKDADTEENWDYKKMRSGLNATLLKKKTLEEVDDTLVVFQKKYGDDIWQKTTNNPSKLFETFQQFVKVHRDRVMDISPISKSPFGHHSEEESNEVSE